MYLFTVMTWRCLIVLFLLIFSFFFLFEFFFVCVAFVFLFFSRSTSTSWFRFVWLLTMSWLNASKSYTNWTIKDILNSDTLLFLLFFIMNSSNRQAHKWETQNSCLSSDATSCWALSGVKQRIQLNHKAEIMVSLFLLSACTEENDPFVQSRSDKSKMQDVYEDKSILMNFYFKSHTWTQMVIKSKIQISI